ncbi:Protein of unknown function [Ruminococcaceae bacterium YRB3002]|nr:Protein of unknown function [Ruminococcaceae bacterium YRB3002]
MKKPDKEMLRLMLADEKKRKIILILSIALVAVIGIGILVAIIANKVKKNDVPVIPDIDDIDIIGSEQDARVEEAKINIGDIIGISELHTLKYDYTSICRYYGENNYVDPVCYISYHGTVVLGVDVNDIVFDYGDEDRKVVTVYLPAIKITSYKVDAGALDYIFVDDSYNVPDFASTAQAKCEEDLLSKIRADEKMFTLASENTEAEVRAMTEPLVRQMYPEYELVIKWKE